MTLTERINEVLATTQPKTTARNKALKAIRWVLAAANGEYAALNQAHNCCTVPDIGAASVFTALDNEKLKAAFWKVQLGMAVEVVVLP